MRKSKCILGNLYIYIKHVNIYKRTDFDDLFEFITHDFLFLNK